MSGQLSKAQVHNAASWRDSVGSLSPYFASCTTPHDFSYPSFMQWNSDNNEGKVTKVALRAEWKRSIDRMKESEVQVLRETAGRLTKEWDAKTHTQDEQSFFIAQSSKEKLERTRQQVHESVDGVMAKRQRLTYHKEDKALDNALREDDYAGFFGASPEHVACRGSPPDRQVGEEAPRTTAIRSSSSKPTSSAACRSSTPPPLMPDLDGALSIEGSLFWDMIGMPSLWLLEGANLSSSFERAKSSIHESFPLMNLCKDNIADFCHSGELQDFMDDKGFSMALDALPTLPNLPQDQQDMLDRLFEGRITLQGLSERIDDLMKVSNPVPALNRYIFTAFQPLRTAFMYTGTISQDINERHYFRDYVVELLRGALSIHGIPYMWGEIYVPAVSYRKANDADATGRGKFADGVSESEGHQILLSESSKLHRAPASKDQDDKMKLKRMLRDLFNFTILEMTKNKDRVKTNLKVFGSRTFKDTTELIAMDYHGMYRTYCLGSFKVVSTANSIKNLKECFEMCLRFSMAVNEQVSERSQMGKLTDAEVIKLTKAARKLLTHTSFTPPKPPTHVSCSPSKQRAQQRAQHKVQQQL